MKSNMFFEKKSNLKNKIILILIVILVILIAFIYKNSTNVKINKDTNKIMEQAVLKENKINLGVLPNWNLNDLYLSSEDLAVVNDLEELSKQTKNFRRYKGKVKKLEAKDLYNAIIEYENILELSSKLSSYAYLLYSSNMSNDQNLKFYQKINEELTNIASQTLFFMLEVNKISNEKLNQLYEESKSLKVYKPVIDDSKAFEPHQLDEKLERLLTEKSLTSRSAWSRLFDETINNMEFEYKGQKYNESEFLNMMSGKDEKIRRETSKIFGETLGKNGKLFAYITNTLAKDKEINDKWMKFKNPISYRNLSNLIEDEVVESLRKTTINNYEKLSHRYYKWKAKQLGKDKLHYSDRNAPLPFAEDNIYTWEQAKKIVLDSYQSFSPEMAKIAKSFFDNNWIDAPATKGKAGGGFMMPTTSKIHPYILLNYTGKTRDVMTLAHELGHGIHQTLSNTNGFFMSSNPLTLAETASVFGEQLTFRNLLNNEKDKQKKKAILANKIEDMLNTVVRQIAFLEFETRVHEERKKGEIPLEKINEIWLNTQKTALGSDIFIFDDEYKNYWMYIPHFIHSPFYVYSYAFGDCLVNSLYGIYQTNSKGFEKKYLNLLSAGSTKRYDELLKDFNLNPKDSNFWQNGMNVISKMIDELEKL